MAKILKKTVLEYHSSGRPGKVEVVPTKPYHTQYDLSLAYTPGVAVPCLEIAKNPEDAYKYTAKGNLVAVISNGTAVLGLGNIGAVAGKPVMEGKGLLFKVFADVDVFDIEVDETDIDKIIGIVKAISPTFGGINLEDIKAPECFEIEDRLKEELNIPVFHDDQHGTAIISAAGLVNALEISGKDISKMKCVVSGAGAAAVSCTRLYYKLGLKPENTVMVDSRGVINNKRTDLNDIKKQFITDRDINTLAEAMKGADLFLGLSMAGVVSKEMLASMAPDPIVFAMANPDPEISYEDAFSVRTDVIFATGRSDYPNQINNVLGFPFIFRGALDVRATKINEEMKIAAVRALADLAKEPVPDNVNKAYNVKNLVFGPEYIIPKPIDQRLLVRVASAVAKAAIDSGVARKHITDWDAYAEELNKRLGYDEKTMRSIRQKAKEEPKKVLFAEAQDLNVLKAVQAVIYEGIAEPVLLGNKEKISKLIKNNGLEIVDVEIIDPQSRAQLKKVREFAEIYYQKRRRKGVNYEEACEKMLHRDYFGVMMVETGEADAFISGMTRKYADTIRPALEIIGSMEGKNIAGMYMLTTKKGPFFFADTTVNINPNADQLVDIALLTASKVRSFNIEPRMAMVSYSNFGASRDKSPQSVRQAVEILHKNHPELIVDGEMQANFALNTELRKKLFPFSRLNNVDVNTIIFPDLNSGNIAYKMMQQIGVADVIGPILLGIRKPVHIIQRESTVKEIVDMTAIAVIDAQNLKEESMS
ncbi:MAG: NADP-dependent malic enzyme [Bacteroidales bacterium]|nr:NADP-dependent malic enzyme [Bacteroidales bacterium]